MAFFNSAVGVLQTLVVALGAGLGIWGAINLLEGYGNDNPGAKSQGMKQLMAGGGVALIGITLVPLLSGQGSESGTEKHGRGLQNQSSADQGSESCRAQGIRQGEAGCPCKGNSIEAYPG